MNHHSNWQMHIFPMKICYIVSNCSITVLQSKLKRLSRASAYGAWGGGVQCTLHIALIVVDAVEKKDKTITVLILSILHNYFTRTRQHFPTVKYIPHIVQGAREDYYGKPQKWIAWYRLSNDWHVMQENFHDVRKPEINKT